MYVYAYTCKNVPAKDIHSWILMPFTQWDSAAHGKWKGVHVKTKEKGRTMKGMHRCVDRHNRKHSSTLQRQVAGSSPLMCRGKHSAFTFYPV